MKAFSAIILLAVLFVAAPAMAQEMPPPPLPVEASGSSGSAKPEAKRLDPYERGMQGEIVACGAPLHTDMPTDGIKNVCDYYTRQIGYYDEQAHHKQNLLERQKNFYAPAKIARDNYQKNLEAHWARMGAAKTGGNQ